MNAKKREELFLELSKQSIEVNMGVKHALDTMNDQNVYHNKTIDKNTKVIRQNTKVINDYAKIMDAAIKLGKWAGAYIAALIFLLVFVLIILAGAEQVFDHWNLKLFQ